MIKTFQDIKVWQKAHGLVIEIYKMTVKFPAEEKYGLSSQIRRAMVSVASNIVEGFKRKSVKDRVHFYNVADASLEEVKYQLLVARDLKYINEILYRVLINSAEEVSKMLNSWIKTQK